jgi:phosphatidylserine/phosphatidylglycerophosphate/cardiolipin synthase-like enzyme
MDGCNYCVLLERGCFEPLDQLITTSRSLFHDVFSKLHDNIEKSFKKFNEILSRPSDERAELFFDFLQLASRSIKVVTYVIDKYAAERLAELKASKNVDIMVVTDSKSLSGDISHLLTASGIQIRTMPNIHAKIYIVDDAIALTGSANLTKKALAENYENIELKTNPDEVKRLADNFVEIWNNARQSEI